MIGPVNEERRAFPRSPSKATARVIRDSDRQRQSIPGSILDISYGGFALLVPVRLEVGESVSVDLENPVQGFKVWRRARVQYVKACAEEGFRVGCVLSNRLTPREVRGLKSPAGAMPGEFKRHRAKTDMHELEDSQPVR